MSLENSFSSLRILIPSDENYFPSLAILFPSLAISFSSDGIYISSDVFSIISCDFFTKVRSFPLKEGKSRKKQANFLRKHQEVAKFKSSENRLFPTNFFWSCKWRVKLGGQNGKSFLSTEGLHLILFSISRFHPLNISSKRTFDH